MLNLAIWQDFFIKHISTSLSKDSLFWLDKICNSLNLKVSYVTFIKLYQPKMGGSNSKRLCVKRKSVIKFQTEIEIDSPTILEGAEGQLDVGQAKSNMTRLGQLKQRWISGDHTLFDMVATILSVVCIAYLMTIILQRRLNDAEEKAEKWMERAVTCESRRISVILVSFCVACSLWLVYLLYLSERHSRESNQLNLAKLDAQNKCILAINQCNHKDEIMKIIKSAGEKNNIELESMRKQRDNWEVRYSYKASLFCHRNRKAIQDSLCFGYILK